MSVGLKERRLPLGGSPGDRRTARAAEATDRRSLPLRRVWFASLRFGKMRGFAE